MASRANGHGWGARLWSVAGELGAFAGVVGALPFRSIALDTLDAPDHHPVPIVLVHGILGDPTNFVALRRHLARHGIRRFSSFAYRPRLDYQHLAAELVRHVEAVCWTTGATQVDVIGHSLGGLVARYCVQTGGATLVRRLVTLGTPYLAQPNPAHELAVFAAEDPIVPPPADRARRRMVVLEACGHLGLLTDARALDAVVRHLGPPALVARRATAVAAAA
jgi:pimeloyl-ACP methyl ester carboxylesterase